MMNDKTTISSNKSHEFSVMKVKCESEISTNYDDAFSGFDNLEVVTFSYDLGFIQEISDLFQKMTIILGCEGIVRDDAYAMVLESQKYAVKEITKHEKLMKRIHDGSISIHIAKHTVSHEKIFLMSCEDSNHTRVISGSANFTRRGFSGPGIQREFIICMEDDELGFNLAHAKFDSLLEECTDEVPEKTLISSENGELMDDAIPVARDILVNNANFLLEKTDFDDEWNETEVLTNLMDAVSKTEKRYPRTSGHSKITSITPKHITEAVKKKKEEDKRLQEKRRNYPSLHLDYDKNLVSFNGKAYDLINIDMNRVTNDLKIMGKYFDGYDHFIGDSFAMKQTYFKLMNFMLLSPFIAELRSVAFFSGNNTAYFPYYALIRGQSNAGKTELVSTIQYLMAGKTIPTLPSQFFKVSEMQGLLETVEGMPMCLDDMNATQFKQADAIVKNDSIFYNEQYIHHGTFIITSNNIKDPKPEISKRMFALTIHATQTNEDATNKTSALHSLVKGLTTSFYSLYLKEMFPVVHDMIYKMNTIENSNTDWRPDIFQASSDAILNIYHLCNIQIPDWATSVSYDDYFGDEVLCHNSIEIIQNAWLFNPKAFRVNKSANVLEYTAGDYPSKAEELMRIIPRKLHPRQVGCKVVMDLDGAKKFFHINFKKKWFTK